MGSQRLARARIFEVQGGLLLLVGRDVEELTNVKRSLKTPSTGAWGLLLHWPCWAVSDEPQYYSPH